MAADINQKDRTWEYTSTTKWWNWNWQELISYHHLLIGLVKREFILYYKQTLLGPIWMLGQPVLTLIIYVLVFGKLVGIPTGSAPPVLFYLSGILLWTFFSEALMGTSKTFQDNFHIFNKVYFPRLIIPLSLLSVHFLRFLVQFSVLFILLTCFWTFYDMPISLSRWTFALPVAVLTIGAMGLGCGLCFSVLTAKYRDLNNIFPTAIRLLMFLTPVIYPVSATPANLHWLILWNPLTPLFEIFKFSLLGDGSFTLFQLLYSGIFALILLFLGLAAFQKQADKLLDVA